MRLSDASLEAAEKLVNVLVMPAVGLVRENENASVPKKCWLYGPLSRFWKSSSFCP